MYLVSKQENFENIRILIEKVISLMRSSYTIIDDFMKILFPFQTDEEISEQVIKNVNSLDGIQLIYYLGRLNNFAEFLSLYFTIALEERTNENIKTIENMIEMINKSLKEIKQTLDNLN